MPTKIATRVPQVRCHECGTVDVHAVCHHCTKALCENHVRWPTGRADEFSRLDLKGTTCGEVPAHCAKCAHAEYTPSWLPVAIGAAILLVGVTLLLRSPGSAAWVIAALGLVGVGGGVAARTYLIDRATRQRPPIPTIPLIERLAIDETHWAQCSLDGHGNYQVIRANAGGTVIVDAVFSGADQDLVVRYGEKYPSVDLDEERIAVGFLALTGNARALDGSPSNNQSPSRVAALDGALCETPYLAGRSMQDPQTADSSHRFAWSADYALRRNEQPVQSPLTVIPALRPSSGRRVLVLVLRWNRIGSDWLHHDVDGEQRNEVRPLTIEHLRIDVIADRVIDVVRGQPVPAASRRIDDRRGPVLTLEWRQVELDDDDDDGNRGSRDIDDAYEIEVELDGPIPPGATIDGTAVVAFDGSLSGYSGGHWFNATGTKRDDGRTLARVTSRAVLEFRLQMEAIIDQDMLVMPDDDLTRRQVRRYEGVVPDERTAVRVVKALTNEDRYVVVVDEHIGQSRDTATKVNRSWSVHGRQVVNFNPIDFHVELSGDEFVGAQRLAQRWGSTAVRLTVQGDYDTARMRDEIKSVWAAIDQTLHTVMRQLRSEADTRGPSIEIDVGALEGDGSSNSAEEVHDV